MEFEELMEEQQMLIEEIAYKDLTAEQEDMLLEEGLEKWRESKEYKEKHNG